MTADDNKVGMISIHSLVKRETAVMHHLQLYVFYFNPLPRKEGDYIVDTLTKS